MNKRVFSILAASALVLSGLVAPTASAQTAVPPVVNIDDPFGDANTQSGDQVGPADLSSVGDIGKIWFSHTAEDISVHFQTQAPPPATQGLVFQVYASPNDAFPAPQGCLRFITIIPGSVAPNYAGPQHVKLVDRCNDAGTSIYNNGVEGEAVIESLGDGTGLITMTFPRSYSPLLSDGAVIAQPHGRTDIPVGGPPPTGFVSLRLDDTVLGTDYELTAGGPKAEEPKGEPPGKDDPPGKGKKKGCPKGKGKKKGACPGKERGKPKPPAAACAAYTPGELGTDQPNVTVTDAATEEKPLEQTVEVAMSAGDLDFTGLVLHAEYAFFNVQVDTKSADAGLYAYVEFPTRRDYDLGLLYPDESYAARARSFNPVVGTPAEIFSAPGHGGEGTDHSEKLLGIRTADCGGYTFEFANWFGEGGEFAIQLWLGEAQNDPLAPGEEPR